jgi:transaldolase
MCNLKINELTQQEKDESLNGMKEINKLKDGEIEHKKRFQESMEGTIKTAKSYYETNRKINIIIVIVGLVFLANSI